MPHDPAYRTRRRRDRQRGADDVGIGGGDAVPPFRSGWERGCHAWWIHHMRALADRAQRQADRRADELSAASMEVHSDAEWTRLSAWAADRRRRLANVRRHWERRGGTDAETRRWYMVHELKLAFLALLLLTVLPLGALVWWTWSQVDAWLGGR